MVYNGIEVYMIVGMEVNVNVSGWCLIRSVRELCGG